MGHFLGVLFKLRLGCSIDWFIARWFFFQLLFGFLEVGFCVKRFLRLPKLVFVPTALWCLANWFLELAAMPHRTSGVETNVTFGTKKTMHKVHLPSRAARPLRRKSCSIIATRYALPPRVTGPYDVRKCLPGPPLAAKVNI